MAECWNAHVRHSSHFQMYWFTLLHPLLTPPPLHAVFIVYLQISSLKAELGRPSEIPRQPPPLPIESASKPPPALPPKEKEASVGDDDAFEDREPSPVAPCPYLSFVPLQDDPRARHKKGKDSKAWLNWPTCGIESFHWGRDTLGTVSSIILCPHQRGCVCFVCLLFYFVWICQYHIWCFTIFYG